jgi:hypothetical protein
VNIEKPWYAVVILTAVMSVATAVGTFVSSYLLIPVKIKEDTAKAAVERKAKGAQLHCEKLQLAVSLATEITFRADRNYSNYTQYNKLLNEQHALEKRAFELVPFLSENEAELLKITVQHHYVVTQMRTSKVPVGQRIPPREGGFDANNELNEMRNSAAKLASAYRTCCTESP